MIIYCLLKFKLIIYIRCMFEEDRPIKPDAKYL